MPRKKETRKRLRAIVIMIAGIAIILVGTALFLLKDTSTDTAGKIAIIPLYGEISLLGDEASSKNVVPLIIKANNDKLVKAIILDIDSPGGTMVASKEIATAVSNVKKPVVALVREVAASGAYWVASAADKIVADPASITGSISVTASYLQFAGTLEKYGAKYEEVVSGNYKDMGSPFKDLTPSERKILQRKVDALNDMFITAIAENRQLSREYVAKLATGEIYLGIEAQKFGLIDYFGDKTKAQHIAEELAGLTKSELVEYKPNLSFAELLSQRIETAATKVSQRIAGNIMGMKSQLTLHAG